MAYKILIVDDSVEVRSALRSVIEHNTDWHVCGEAENGKDAIEQFKRLKPDSVVLDLQMPVMNGFDAAREISRMAPNVALLMFTVHRSEELVRVARVAGTKEVVSNDARAADDLISAIRISLASISADGERAESTKLPA